MTISVAVTSRYCKNCLYASISSLFLLKNLNCDGHDRGFVADMYRVKSLRLEGGHFHFLIAYLIYLSIHLFF